jgi:hypothetical protein
MRANSPYHQASGEKTRGGEYGKFFHVVPSLAKT